MSFSLQSPPRAFCSAKQCSATCDMAETDSDGSCMEIEVESESSVDEDSDCSENTTSTEASRLVGSLSSAKPAAISRTRKVARNPNRPRQRTRCGPSTQLKRKSAWECVKDFPGEHFIVEKGKVFCSTCRLQLGLKTSSLKRHVKTSRHTTSKATFEKAQKRQVTVLQSLKAYEECHHPVGETLPEKERLWRVEVVASFLRAGVPLSKIDGLRQLLERNATRLTSRTHLAGLIPFILQEEKDKFKAELKGRCLSIIFDGSTRQGEALAIVVRFLDANWEIQQRLVRIHVLSKSLTGEQLARELLLCLSTELQTPAECVVAAMRDGSTVNTAALRNFKMLYNDTMAVTCFSHTIDCTGKLFDTPTLDVFVQWWSALFAHSAAAKLRWKQQTGHAMKSYSRTRWWSKWEMIRDILTYFGDIQPFLEDMTDLAPKIRDRLLPMLEDEEQKERLQLEIAVMVDAGEPLVKATYNMEGDGPLALTAYKILQEVSTAVGNRHYPNTDAVIQRITDDQLTATQLQQEAQACVQPATEYFLRKFNVEHYNTVRAFRAARMLCPMQVCQLQPQPAAVDELRLFPFLDDDVCVNSLKQELPAYVAAAEGVTKVDPVEWWKHHAEELPTWSSAVAKVVLVQPSSAAAERVFSLLQQAFTHQQDEALEDYIEACIMLQYNKRKN